MGWSDLTTNQKIVTITSILTGIMHLLFSSQFAGLTVFGFLDGMVGFVINGLGFFVIIFLLYFFSGMKDNQQMLRYLLVAWTGGSILGWLLYHLDTGATSYLDQSLMNKVIEVVLLVFLARDIMDKPAPAA